MSDEDEVVVEDDTSNETEEQTAEQVMPADMKGFTLVQIILWLENEINVCRVKLENEPSGRVLAHLQGKIPGCKFGLEAMKEIFNLSEDFFNSGKKPLDLSMFSQEEILGVEQDMEDLQKREEWQQFLNRIQSKAEELKDFLLFRAKKSRDLDLSQGEYNGMVMYQKLFDAIDDSAGFWKTSLFKKQEAENATRDANDPNQQLLPPGLPAPEDAEDAEYTEEDYGDPDMGMGDVQ